MLTEEMLERLVVRPNLEFAAQEIIVELLYAIYDGHVFFVELRISLSADDNDREANAISFSDPS